MRPQRDFDHIVVVRVADGAQGWQEPCLPSTLGECPGGELRAVIPVDHGPRLGFSCVNRHGERVGCQVCACTGIDGPVVHPPGERVQHNATEQFPLPRGVFRNVRHL